VVKTLLEEVQLLTAEDDQWKAKFTVIIENVEHHAEEEETELFKMVGSAMTSDQLEELGTRLEARKAELGAPVAAEAIELSKAQLSKLATEQQIPGRSSMSHDELAATVDAR